MTINLNVDMEDLLASNTVNFHQPIILRGMICLSVLDNYLPWTQQPGKMRSLTSSRYTLIHFSADHQIAYQQLKDEPTNQ